MGHWSKAEQMGYQAVEQAAQVGLMLIELKAVTAHGEFKNRTRAALQGASNDTGERLMTLARHLPLLQQHQPDSQRKASRHSYQSRTNTAGGVGRQQSGSKHSQAAPTVGQSSHHSQLLSYVDSGAIAADSNPPPA